MSSRIAAWLLATYLAGLALVAFWPTPVDRPIAAWLDQALVFLHNHGAPGWVDYNFVEATANIALFIPFGLLVALLLPLRLWWIAILLGTLASEVIELGQLWFLDSRHATIQDVVVNAVGSALGAVVMWLARLSVQYLQRINSSARMRSDQS